MGRVARSVRRIARRLIDPADQIGARSVAALLGLARPQAVHTYRKRYPDFPAPVYEGEGIVLWLRQDVEAWRAKHPPRRRTES